MEKTENPIVQDSNRELRSILMRGYESKDLDYKSPAKWDEGDKRACCELVKDILGMANTLGGFIVIGVSEVANGFRWDGVTSTEASTFETTRLNRFIQNYCDPPINTLLKKVEHEEKTFVVIEVPRFPDTPHLCQKDFPGTLAASALYVRTDNNESAPIRSSADFRLVLEQAVRNRSDALLAAVRSILTSGSVAAIKSIASTDQFAVQYQSAIADFERLNPLKEKDYKGYREVTFTPRAFLKERFEIDQLRSAAHSASVSFSGWPFLFIHLGRPDVTSVIQDGLETLISTEDFGGNDMLDFWRFQQSGFFFHRTLMWEDAQAKNRGDGKLELGTGGVATHAAEAVNCLSNLYRELLGEDEQVTLALRLLGTQGRVLASPSRMLSGSYISRIPEILVERTHSLADWQAGIVDHAVDISKEIFIRFNWSNPNLDSARHAIEKLFARQL